MNEIILAISTFCSIGIQNTLTGYYSIEMDRKMTCQKEILKCIAEKYL